MKILITGGSGLLGQYLNEKLSHKNEILTIYKQNTGNCHHFNSINLDITDKGKFSFLFNNFRPDAVIHTACYSRPEICSKLSRDEVYRLNVDVTEHIAQLCNGFDSKLIFTSTDLVYDGEKNGMLTEESDLNPLTLYAESKLMGEITIQNYSNNYIILRTALLIGFGKSHSTNNFHTTYEKLKARERVKLFYDQYRTPLSLTEASEFIERMCFSDIQNQIINFGGKYRISRFEIGEILSEIARFDKELIEPVSCRLHTDTIQVPDVSMNTDKLQNFGYISKDIYKSIYEMITNYTSKP